MAQIPAILSSLTVAVSDSDQKTVKAAKDFEALLIGQMLRSMRGDKSWLGTGDESDSEDSADDSALSLGEQQVAQAIAAGGGLGLSRMIAMGLPAHPSPLPKLRVRLSSRRLLPVRTEGRGSPSAEQIPWSVPSTRHPIRREVC